MPSETAIVTNLKGTPPASRTATLVRLANRSRGRLHGVTSFQLDATPIWGLTMSSSPRPMARNIARAGAPRFPSVTSVLRGVGWFVMSKVYETWTSARPKRLRLRVDADGLAGREQFDPRLTGTQRDHLAGRVAIGRAQADVAAEPRSLLQATVGEDLDRTVPDELGVGPLDPDASVVVDAHHDHVGRRDAHAGRRHVRGPADR